MKFYSFIGECLQKCKIQLRKVDSKCQNGEKNLYVKLTNCTLSLR